MALNLKADHIGSLLRPPELLQARADAKDGKISREALEQAEDSAILKALDLQKQAGLGIFSDGEYRRETFLDPGFQGMSGVVTQPGRPTNPIPWQGPNSDLANQIIDDEPMFTVTVAAEKLRRTGRLTTNEGAFLSRHAPGPWKETMPGPVLRAVQMFRPGV
ncbi:MAG TPA: hypothetical protein VG845_07565, partial [Dehalococcoidia bacterium]|nr:hypothetical protein [Dehalococcoidia bacterium]